MVLDEIQNQPEMLQLLRGEIDVGSKPGRFLILGSASFKLLKQSQSLAGRLALVNMALLLLSEMCNNFVDTQTLWLRGGFPNSYMVKKKQRLVCLARGADSAFFKHRPSRIGDQRRAAADAPLLAHVGALARAAF